MCDCDYALDKVFCSHFPINVFVRIRPRGCAKFYLVLSFASHKVAAVVRSVRWLEGAGESVGGITSTFDQHSRNIIDVLQWICFEFT